MKNKLDISISEIAGFGVGVLPGAFNSIISAFLIMFYTDSIHMAAGAVGTMFFISKFFDGITDLIAGTMIDRTKSKWGKARPWLLWFSVPMGISLVLMFLIPVGASEEFKLIYAFLTYNLFSSVVYTVVGIAGNSLLPLMTQDGKSRGILASTAMIFGFGGTLVGMSITFPFIFAVGGDVRAWRIVYAVYGIVATVSLLLSFVLVREKVKPVDSSVKLSNKISFIDGIKLFFKNKYLIFALIIVLLMNLSLNLNSSSQTYYYTYAMNDALLTSKLNLLNLIPMVLSVMFLPTIFIAKFGKKNSVLIGGAGTIIGYVLKGLAVSQQNVMVLMIGTIIGALSTGPISIPINLLVADAIDYGEYIYNRRIEGIGNAVVSFSQKFTAGLAVAIVGWSLELTGYIANKVQNEMTIWGINSLFSWIPMLLVIIICLGYLLWYKYDQEEANVLAELQARKMKN